MSRLQDIKKQKYQVQQEIRSLTLDLRVLQNEIDGIEFGVKIGDDVEHEGERYCVVSFHSFEPKGLQYKLNGELGKNIKCLHWINRKDL